MKTVKLIKLPEIGLSRFCFDGLQYESEHNLREKYYYRNGNYYISIKEFFNILRDFTKEFDTESYGKNQTYTLPNIKKVLSRYTLHTLYVVKYFFPNFKNTDSKKKLNRAEVNAHVKEFLSKYEEEYYCVPKYMLVNPYSICDEGKNVYQSFINGTEYVYATEKEIKSLMKKFIEDRYSPRYIIAERIFMHLAYFVYSYAKHYDNSINKSTISKEMQGKYKLPRYEKLSKANIDRCIDIVFKTFKKYYKSFEKE